MNPVFRSLLLALLMVTQALALPTADQDGVRLDDLLERGFTHSAPLSIAEIEQKSLEELKVDSSRVPQLPFGFANGDWEEFKAQVKPGDEILRVCSSPDSWASLAGWEGLVLVRDGIIIASITETIS